MSARPASIYLDDHSKLAWLHKEIRTQMNINDARMKSPNELVKTAAELENVTLLRLIRILERQRR